jgi:uncharacterized protein
VSASSRLLPSAEAAGPAAVVETHCALVLFVGDRAYKIKKSVDLGFVDFTDRQVRRRTLQRELELNRRMAPDVYLDVADLVDADGAPVESVLVMKRLPAERSLARLVRDGAPGLDELVRAVARAVAAFHASTETSPEVARAGDRDVLQALWTEGLDQQEGFAGSLVDPEGHARTRLLAARYLAGRQPLLQERVRQGRVRDGHGDLLAEDVFCLGDGPRILDCIEFDDRLRHGDLLLDVAFLAMDLERLGRPDLAAVFLHSWTEFSGDSYAPSLLEHYVAYRAHVRSKVACLRAGQGDAHAADEARALARLCLDHLERARVRLVLVGGLPGTGKSTLAAGVANADGWLLLRSDEVRKSLAGLRSDDDASAPYRTGIYDPDRTEEVYAELLDRAAVALARGESVVLDASWTDRGFRRRAAELAERTSSDLVELQCTVPTAVAAARLTRRRWNGKDASDADPDVAARMAVRADSWPSATRLSTEAEPAAVLEVALSLVGPQTRPGAVRSSGEVSGPPRPRRAS